MENEDLLSKLDAVWEHETCKDSEYERIVGNMRNVVWEYAEENDQTLSIKDYKAIRRKYPFLLKEFESVTNIDILRFKYLSARGYLKQAQKIFNYYGEYVLPRRVKNSKSDIEKEYFNSLITGEFRYKYPEDDCHSKCTVIHFTVLKHEGNFGTNACVFPPFDSSLNFTQEFATAIENGFSFADPYSAFKSYVYSICKAKKNELYACYYLSSNNYYMLKNNAPKIMERFENEGRAYMQKVGVDDFSKRISKIEEEYEKRCVSLQTRVAYLFKKGYAWEYDMGKGSFKSRVKGIKIK